MKITLDYGFNRITTFENLPYAVVRAIEHLLNHITNRKEAAHGDEDKT